MNQQEALVKLATVRLAINYVLRSRAMQKQAEGGLTFDKDPGVEQPAGFPDYGVRSIPDITYNRAPWAEDYSPSARDTSVFDTKPVPNSLGGITRSALQLGKPSNLSAGQQIDRKYGVPTAMALDVLSKIYPATRLGQATGLADAVARVNPLDGRQNWTADVAQRLYDKLVYDPLSKRRTTKQKAKDAVEQPLKGQQSLAPPEFFTPNPSGQETNPGWNPLSDAGLRFPEGLRFR